MISKLSYIMLLNCLLFVGIQDIAGQTHNPLSKAWDFTVLENQNIAVVYDGSYQEISEGFVGVLQALDYKGRLQFDRRYLLKIPDSLMLSEKENIKITEAYAVSLTNNNSLFYGQISAKRPMTFAIILDKKGRVKKQIFKEIDLSEIVKKTEVKSFRTGTYLWLVANQLNLQLAPYFSPHSKNFSQVYLRKVRRDQSEIMFDSFSLNQKDSTTIIRYKDDIQVKWEHELKGVFKKGISSFKLTETAKFFYFVLYLEVEKKLTPTVYVIDKNTGKISLQSLPRRSRA